MSKTSKRKVDAIYELREAAEAKAAAEKTLEEQPTQQRREEWLDAQLALERKTLEAIEACHECGHEHRPQEPHAVPGGNVVSLDKRREAKESG